MIAAIWLSCRDCMLLWMKLHMLSVPETSKAKLMEELITLEVDAAKVFEESNVEVFLSSVELQLIELRLEIKIAFHRLHPLQSSQITIHEFRHVQDCERRYCHIRYDSIS